MKKHPVPNCAVNSGGLKRKWQSGLVLVDDDDCDDVVDDDDDGDDVAVYDDDDDDDDDDAVNDDPHVEEEGYSAGCLVFSVGPLIEPHYQRISY